LCLKQDLQLNVDRMQWANMAITVWLFSPPVCTTSQSFTQPNLTQPTKSCYFTTQPNVVRKILSKANETKITRNGNYVVATLLVVLRVSNMTRLASTRWLGDMWCWLWLIATVNCGRVNLSTHVNAALDSCWPRHSSRYTLEIHRCRKQQLKWAILACC